MKEKIQSIFLSIDTALWEMSKEIQVRKTKSQIGELRRSLKDLQDIVLTLSPTTPQSVKEMIEAEAYKRYPINLKECDNSYGQSFDTNLMERETFIEGAIYQSSLGMAQGVNVDWDKIKSEFDMMKSVFDSAEQIFQWFKSKIQGAKVVIEPDTAFVDERQFLREAKEYNETGYTEPVEQGEVLSAGEWFAATYPNDDMTNFAYSHLMEQYSNYVLLCRKNEGVDKWISVIDDNPDLHSHVLARYNDGMMDVCKYTLIFSKAHFVANAMVMDEYVTHWQPLPTFHTK